MLLGGIPYYLSLLKPQLSLPENIDELVFRRNGELADEFDELFPALFNKSDKYVRIVRMLSTRREGFTSFVHSQLTAQDLFDALK